MDIAVLEAVQREGTGSRDSRRIRRAGGVPAVLYGHGQEVAPLVVNEEALRHVIEHERQTVDLKLGAETQRALIKDVQFDVWGRELLHVDFARVSKDERVVVTVPIEFHGTPNDVQNGAMLEHPAVAVDVECRVDQIPEHIRVNVGEMMIGDAIHVEDINLPAGVTAQSEPRSIVAILHAPRAEEEEEVEEVEAAEGEPEVIGRAAKEESEEDK